jgi:4-amino-4-deoxy-L-arabinose transferase-like glycosyltransferase
MLIGLLVDAALIFGWALLIGAVLHLSTRPARLIGWFVLAYANIVLTGEIAGTFFLAGSRAFYLLAHLVLLIAAGWIWRRAGRPPLIGTPGLWRVERPRRSEAALWVLGIGVLLAYLVAAAVTLIAPPNTPDAMTYHLSRVGYWLQQGSLYHWPTYDLRQTAFPINYELGLLWIATFVRNDTLLGLVQWSAVPVMMAGVIGVARIMGHTRRAALFAALLVFTFPIVILQAVSAKNDLLIGALVIGAIYLLLLGLQENQRGPLWVSATAFGIAAGVKTTLVMLLPGMIILALLLWRRYGFRRMAEWGTMGAAAFVVLGSYNYVLNELSYGHPLGTKEFVEEESTGGMDNHDGVINIFRYAYQAADTSTLPDVVHRAKAKLAGPIFDLAGIATTPDPDADDPFDLDKPPRTVMNHVWLGPIGSVLIFALLPIGVIAVWRRDMIQFGLAAMGIGFLIILSVTIDWSPFRGRHAPLLAAVIAPLMAAWYQRLAVARWLVIGLALYSMSVALTYNARAVLVGDNMIWQRDRYALQAQGAPSHWRESLLRYFDQEVPPDAVVGLWLERNDWDYPFFGEHFTRTLILIYPYPDRIDSAWLAEQAFDYLLVKNTLYDQPFLPELVEKRDKDGFTLLQYVPDD